MSASASIPTPATRLRTWFRGRLFARLITATFTLLALIAVFASVHNYQLERRELVVHIDAFAGKLAEATASAWSNAIVGLDYSVLDEYTADFVKGPTPIAFVRVELADGRIASQWPRTSSGPLPDGGQIRNYTAPVRLGATTSPGKVTFGIPMAKWEQELQDRMVGHLTQFAIALVLIAMATYWMLQRMVGDPLRRLDAAAAELGTGNFGTPIACTSTDELGRLAATLERMRTSLQSSHQALAQQNSRLMVLDRLKTQFLANMSHEIRTPLNSIIGCTEFLSESELSSEERGVYVDILRRNGKHLLTLVSDILDYSKMESGNLVLERQPTDLSELVREVVDSLRPRIGAKPVTLSSRVDSELPGKVLLDPVRVRQILLNTVDNAIKFTLAGSVTITVDAAPQAAGLLRVVIADTGIGISKAALGKLFQPFSQADGSTTRRFGGTGLGLMISRRLAELHGGDITLESEEGKGSKLTITLGVPNLQSGTGVTSAQRHAQLDKSPAPVSLPPLRGRVLLIDDGIDNQRVLRAMLEKAGCNVAVAENGQVGSDLALAEAKGDHPFDLIIMDLQMPVMDGITATKRLRASGLSTPIVALTANALAEERERCLAAGCTAFATKPISRARVLEIVREHLAPASEQNSSLVASPASA